MATFRFLIIHLEDIPKVTGTNDEEIAQYYAEAIGTFTVVDTVTNKIKRPVDFDMESADAEYLPYLTVQEDTIDLAALMEDNSTEPESDSDVNED
jgi:hypothetical protein